MVKEKPIKGKGIKYCRTCKLNIMMQDVCPKCGGKDITENVKLWVEKEKYDVVG